MAYFNFPRATRLLKEIGMQIDLVMQRYWKDPSPYIIETATIPGK